MHPTTLYEITKNSDGIEGKGKTVSTGIAFEHERDAIKFASSEFYAPFAVMNVVDPKMAKHNIRVINLRVWSDFESFDDEVDEAAREKQKVLDKLSSKERRILGFA